MQQKMNLTKEGYIVESESFTFFSFITAEVYLSEPNACLKKSDTSFSIIVNNKILRGKITIENVLKMITTLSPQKDFIICD